MRVRWALLAAAAIGVGCAGVLGIPDGTPSFCAQPANQGHDYCEDFDVGDAASRWTFVETTNGATWSFQPSDQSPPNLVDLAAPAQPEGGSALAGFDKEFDNSTFVGLHVEADVRFVTQGDAGLTASGGFLLITDKSGGCVALGLGLGGGPGSKPSIGALVFSKAAACSFVTGNGGLGSTAPTNQIILTDAPAPNTWFHIKVIVAPDPHGLPGSGALTFNIVGPPAAVPIVHLDPGTLVPSGIPLVGFAALTNGPSGSLEVQYDNITIDLSPN